MGMANLQDFHTPSTEVQRWDVSKHGQDEERQPREETSHAMADSLSRQKYGKKQKEGQ